MKLSVVTAMYKSAAFVRPFYEAVSDVAKKLVGPDGDWEIVFVDDRSPDDSAEIVEKLIGERGGSTSGHVRLIQLSRNFGQSAAMLAGLRRATGDYVYTSDIDLEDPIDLLPKFYEMMKADPRTESVYGFMSKRKGTLGERVLGAIFYKILSSLSREKIPDQVWARLMTRKFVDALLSFSEYHLFWSGLLHTVGFKQQRVPVDRKKTGKTSYNLTRRMQLALTAITSFSSGPLYFVFLMGFAVSVLSVLGMLALLVQHLRGGIVPGWGSIVCAVLFMGGVTNLSIGLIGIYVGRIFVQTKGRPHFVIDREL